MDEWVYEFVDLWKSLKVNELQKALDLKHQNLPKSIFKYRCFDENNYSINNLINDNVWLSSPSTFNDPCDSFTSIDYDLILEKIRLDSQKKIAEFNNVPIEAIKQMKDYCSPALMLELKQVKKTSKLKLKQGFDSMRNSLNICSFSESKDNILMWSHYSDNHKGFCIEYDLFNIERENKLKERLLPVIYVENIFDITNLIYLGPTHYTEGNFILLMPLYKYLDWKYEKEWRLVLIDYEKNTEEYSMPIPKAVYLGSMIEPENKKKIIQIAKDKNIDVYQMQMSPTEFKLTADLLFQQRHCEEVRSADAAIHNNARV